MLALPRLRGKYKGRVARARAAASQLDGEAHSSSDGLESEAPTGGRDRLNGCVVGDKPAKDDSVFVDGTHIIAFNFCHVFSFL